MKISINIALFILMLVIALILNSCSTTKLSSAIEQYENGEYFEASIALKKIYRKTDQKENRKQKGELAWYLGNCYDKLMIWSQASSYYQNAKRFGYEYEQLNERIEDCLLKEGRKKNKANQISRYTIKKFNVVNSKRADFSTAIWGSNDDELYYTTSNDKVIGSDNSKITGTKYFDIWVTKKDENGNWQKPQSLGEDFNSNGDEGTPCFSPDGNTMYYTVSGHESNSRPVIYYSKRSDATWSKGQLLKITNDSLATIAHPAVSPDGKYLYFCSDIIGGNGGKDLWRATINGDIIGYIENLGDKINSEYDELFPTFSNDGILYFSSNRKGGYGALDIYSAREDEWGIWHIEHLDAPINSNADDFGMTFKRNTKEQQEGWFSSNRNSPKGYDNIYSFVLPSINVKISGFVFDTDGNPIQKAIVRVVGRNGMNFKSVTKPDGSYEVNIDRSTEYVMMSGKKGFLNRKAQFISDDEEEDADYEVDFYLPSVSEPVLVENVFYDYNESTLRKESYPSLDDLAALLIDNPYTVIELSSHTDRIGSQSFNLQLSKRRAESVCDYLISKGIESERLVPVGYGKEKPKAVDVNIAKSTGWEVGQELNEEFIEQLTEEQKKYADQINRRTEFKVLTTTWGIR